MALGYDAETATTMAVIDRVQALKVEAQSVNQSGG